MGVAMNFDFGEVLTRAGQITWKHKILWLLSALPVLLSFLIFPVVFLPIFFADFNSYSEPFFVEQPVYIILFVGFSFFISILSFALYVISSSSVTLGVVQVEGGAEKLETMKLFDDGKRYWLRVMGVMLLIGIGVSLVFMVLFGCMALFGAVTIGIGFICMQPLILLMYPLMLVLYGIIEESQVAVIVDDLSVVDAIRRGWELVRANVWSILFISFIVYLGIGILSFIITIPFMIPFFFIPFFMQDSSNFDARSMMLFIGGFSLLLLPVMAFVQGVTITFLKATYALVYMRLTKPQDNAPAMLKTNA
jgi:hypothetical protein